MQRSISMRSFNEDVYGQRRVYEGNDSEKNVASFLFILLQIMDFTILCFLVNKNFFKGAQCSTEPEFLTSA